MTIKPLQPHQQRVVQERDELQERLQKLNAFLETQDAHRDSDIRNRVGEEELGRLREQSRVMGHLLLILNDRIAHF